MVTMMLLSGGLEEEAISTDEVYSLVESLGLVAYSCCSKPNSLLGVCSCAG